MHCLRIATKKRCTCVSSSGMPRRFRMNRVAATIEMGITTFEANGGNVRKTGVMQGIALQSEGARFFEPCPAQRDRDRLRRITSDGFRS